MSNPSDGPIFDESGRRRLFPRSRPTLEWLATQQHAMTPDELREYRRRLREPAAQQQRESYLESIRYTLEPENPYVPGFEELTVSSQPVPSAPPARRPINSITNGNHPPAAVVSAGPNSTENDGRRAALAWQEGAPRTIRVTAGSSTARTAIQAPQPTRRPQISAGLAAEMDRYVERIRDVYGPTYQRADRTTNGSGRATNGVAGSEERDMSAGRDDDRGGGVNVNGFSNDHWW